MRRAWIAAAAVLAAGVGIAVRDGTSTDVARADVPPIDPPDTKRVAVSVELHWGVLADRVSRPYVVKKGDTLSTIAAAECGSATRWKTIADANPDAVTPPDVIRAGSTLWLPSLRAFDAAPAADAKVDPKLPPAWCDAFWMRPISRWEAGPGARATPTADFAKPVADTLIVVRHDAVGRVLEDARKGAVWTQFPKDGVWSLPLDADGVVHRDEPTVRVRVRYRIAGVEGSRVLAEREITHFDAAGKVVEKVLPIPGSEPPVDPAPRDEKAPEEKPQTPPRDGGMMDIAPEPVDEGRWPAWSAIAVAAAGAAVVAWVALRRRRDPPAS